LWRRRQQITELTGYKSLYAMLNDALQSVEHILQMMIDGRIGVKELEDIIANDVVRRQFNPIYSSIAALLLEVIPSSEDTAAIARKLKSLLRDKAGKMVKNAIRGCMEDVVGRARSLVVIGYDEIVNECIIGSKRVSRVYVLESRPWGDGIREVEFLRSKGIEAILVPDYAVQQVVDESEIALIPVNAVTYDGYALLRTGSKPLVLAFQDRGRDAYGLTVSIAFLASQSSTTLAPNISKLKIYVREVNEEAVIDIYELVNLRKLKYVVTDIGLYEPEELDVEGEAYNVIQSFLTEIIGAEES